MNFKKLNAIDWITIIGIVVSASVLTVAMSGCSLRAKVYTTKDACCERLDLRVKEMKEFNRYCIMMVFADRKTKDPKIREDIKRRVNLCKYVFGVPRDQDLMSHLENKSPKPHNAWRQVYHDFWNPPISCNPVEVHCEEF